MSTEVPVPILGESISEATVATWFKNLGDMVLLDEPLVELETDKVTLEVNSPISGVLSSILCETGANVEVGALLCVVSETTNSERAILEKAPNQLSSIVAETKPEELIEPSAPSPSGLKTLSPAVRKLIDDNNLDPTLIKPSGKDGRILKADVLAAIQAKTANAFPENFKPSIEQKLTVPKAARPDDPREERVKMNRLRQVIARRLKEAQNTAAMLTTYNEVDMGAVMELRSQYREKFEKKHGVRLGLCLSL